MGMCKEFYCKKTEFVEEDGYTAPDAAHQQQSAVQTKALPFLSPEQQPEALEARPSLVQPAADDALAWLKPRSAVMFVFVLVGFGLVGRSRFFGDGRSSRGTP